MKSVDTCKHCGIDLRGEIFAIYGLLFCDEQCARRNLRLNDSDVSDGEVIHCNEIGIE